MLDFLMKKPSDARDGDPVLVLLHGRGSDMRDLQGLAQVLPPRGTLITPQAPHFGEPWGYGPGWAWYRYLGPEGAEADSLLKRLKALAGFLHRLPESLGFQPGPLVLGGFSQGGTTALAYALTHPGKVAGVVVLSGFLAGAEGLGAGPEALGDTPLFWAHGTQDPAVPFQLALEGWRAVEAVGGKLESRKYPMGHWVTSEEVSDLKAWMEGSIPGWVGSLSRHGERRHSLEEQAPSPSPAAGEGSKG
jgi:phospholipase/carboxylesterase